MASKTPMAGGKGGDKTPAKGKKTPAKKGDTKPKGTQGKPKGGRTGSY